MIPFFEHQDLIKLIACRLVYYHRAQGKNCVFQSRSTDGAARDGPNRRTLLTSDKCHLMLTESVDKIQNKDGEKFKDICRKLRSPIEGNH